MGNRYMVQERKESNLLWKGNRTDCRQTSFHEWKTHQILELCNFLLEIEVSGGGTNPAWGVDIVTYTPSDKQQLLIGKLCMPSGNSSAKMLRSHSRRHFKVFTAARYRWEVIPNLKTKYSFHLKAEYLRQACGSLGSENNCQHTMLGI